MLPSIGVFTQNATNPISLEKWYYAYSAIVEQATSHTTACTKALLDLSSTVPKEFRDYISPHFLA
jgi:hypothetical protein